MPIAGAVALLAGVASCSMVLRDVAVPAPAESASRTQADRVAALPSNAVSLASYQREFAERVHAANADRVYEGRPPNPLRAIIVYRTEIDASGEPIRVQLYRSPGAPELEARAAESVRRAAPFPRPHPALLRERGRVELLETWLFDYNGRFRLRTLAQAQAAE